MKSNSVMERSSGIKYLDAQEGVLRTMKPPNAHTRCSQVRSNKNNAIFKDSSSIAIFGVIGLLEGLAHSPALRAPVEKPPPAIERPAAFPQASGLWTSSHPEIQFKSPRCRKAMRS